ncbi:MAG: DUF2799 domain-containing protein [Bdellovibrionaceae bacterium]|nr:DUF2799 domain-containing protein [Pseudobdellovibrionaceae bacterium]
MKSLQYLLGLLLIFSLTACNSWNKEKCQNTNWDALGYGEGAQGKPNASASYATRCEKQGVKINYDSYLVGYNRGLTQYCSYDRGYQNAMDAAPIHSLCSSNLKYKDGYAKGVQAFCTHDNGYKRGTEGHPLTAMCGSSTKKAYHDGYKKGRKIFLQKEVQEIGYDISRANNDLNRIRDTIADKQFQLQRIPTHSAEPSVIQLRHDLESELSSLISKRDGIIRQISDMESTLTSYERELRSL